MPDQVPNIELKPGSGGRLVYDKARRTIVTIPHEREQVERQRIIDEAYRLFPDEVEPVDYHPLGKIVVDRGNLRFAFLEGARFATTPVPNGTRGSEAT